MQDFKVIK